MIYVNSDSRNFSEELRSNFYNIQVSLDGRDRLHFEKTHSIKDELKAKGFKFDGLKKSWYVTPKNDQEIIDAINFVDSLDSRELYTTDEDIYLIYIYSGE